VTSPFVKRLVSSWECLVTSESTHLSLNQAQRRAIGHGIYGIHALLRELKVEGYKGGCITDLEDALEHFEQTTAAEPPRAARSNVAVIFAQLLTLVYELRPSTLEEYGPLDAAARAYLDREAARLIELTGVLIDTSSTR
jgi:hypothetical protein